MSIFSETLLEILSELHGTSGAIQASAIVSNDGLLMATLMGEKLQKKLDEERVAAMTTAIFAQAKRSVHEIKLGGLQQVLVKGKAGYSIVMAAGEQAVLIVLLDNSAQLGLSLLGCERCTQQITATGIVKPGPRMGLVYLGRSKNYD
jgi:predicted regulator of Ras-like GTPase activity (Roadblock/LC7/MglB family)